MAAGGAHVVGPGLPELVALVNLLVVVGVIYVFARKGIALSISRRAEGISKNLGDAKKELEAVEARLKKAKAEVSDLNAKKQEVLNSVRLEGERVAAQIIEETNKAANQILLDAELSAKSELRNAALMIKGTLVEQTFTQTISQLEGSSPLAQSQKTNIHEKLFEKFVTEIPQQLRSAGGSANGS